MQSSAITKLNELRQRQDELRRRQDELRQRQDELRLRQDEQQQQQQQQRQDEQLESQFLQDQPSEKQESNEFQFKSLKPYHLTKMIGKGSYGSTWLATPDNETKYAIKIVLQKNLDDINTRFEPGQEKYLTSFDNIRDEAKMLKKIGERNSPYVVKYIDDFITTHAMNSAYCIVMEYVFGQSLFDFCKYNINLDPIRTLYPLMFQLLTGLYIIHDSGFAHNDIKPENIMITPEKLIKYIDFGLGCQESCVSCTNLCDHRVGSPMYMSPEYLTAPFQEGLRIAQCHDVWSLAIVFFHLCDGNDAYPFDHRTRSSHGPAAGFRRAQHVIQEIVYQAPTREVAYNLDNGISRDFINSMLNRNIDKRPTAKECLALLSLKTGISMSD